MYKSFAGTKKLLRRPKKIDKPRPDNFVFRLHYQFTFGILAICCIMVTSYQYIDSKGSSIQCMLDKGIGVGDGLINKYCWIMSTYTLPKHFEGEKGTDFIHHGVGPENEEEDERLYHAYYQWVPLMLSMQAAMFYLPHWIWKQLENGRLGKLIAGLNHGVVTEDDDKKKKQEVDNLANYMKEKLKDPYAHKMWTAKLYFCETLNLVNVIFQIQLTDRFLGGAFSRYGLEAASWSGAEAETRVDPLSRVFPQMTKCDFHKFGPSGTIQKFDALCVLGMNIINEKIYVFLWFWFVFLAVATAINLVVKLITLFTPSVRSRMVVVEEHGFRHVDDSARETTEKVISRLSYPDWLVLYYLAQCMEKRNFSRLIAKLCDTHQEVEQEEEDIHNVGDDSTLKSKANFKNLLSYKKSSNV